MVQDRRYAFATRSRIGQSGAVLDSYFVCATPRTGSTLLCGLLATSGVAGLPESYFRVEDEAAWAARFGLDERSSFVDFAAAARNHGSTANGVFAARVMWGTLTELVNKLRPQAPGARTDLDVLRRVFGNIEFVYLWRSDVVAQAVSWARAEQTNVWHTSDHAEAVTEPVFDPAQIAELVTTIHDHNRAWRHWFRRVDVKPHRVGYEDLDRAPEKTARAILRAFGLDATALRLEVRDQRLSDQVNATWIARFREGA